MKRLLILVFAAFALVGTVQANDWPPPVVDVR